MKHCATATVFLLLLLLTSACGHESTGEVPWDTTQGSEIVDPGSPALLPATGYMGSVACETCHKVMFEDWAETFHNLSIRTTDKPGATGVAVVADSNRNGVDDFKDGLDLASDPDFAAFGTNAPKLRYVSGSSYPYQVVIGNVTIAVWRTIGGNGFWRQRYLAQVTEGSFPLPIQYNEGDNDWVPYAVETWYDSSGDPLFADTGELEDDIDPADSFDLNCMGCHSTGLEVEFDAASNRYLTGYREISIGCETCHGPGQAHVEAAGAPDLILNPADLIDGTANGVLAADMVCGQCHIQGHGDIPAGGADPTGYAWKTGGSTFPPGGTNLDDYITATKDPDDYWRFKDNPLGFAPTPDNPTDDTFVAARAAEMQFIELAGNFGAHAPDVGYAPACFSCHNPHKRVNEHQIRDTITRGGVTFTNVKNEDNSLCLACHKGHGDFADVTADDVDAITEGEDPAGVVSAVVDHMKDKAAMPIRDEVYDPDGSGTGQCSGCHQTMMARSGSGGTDAAGNLVGDLHTHTFEPVWPNVTEIADERVTNSCNTCHPIDDLDRATKPIEEWSVDPDNDGTFHADTPRNFQTGVANPEREGGIACVSCHTTEGFIEVQINGDSIHDLTDDSDAPRRTEIIFRALGRDEGITCQACHGKTGSGDYLEGQNPLRMPRDQLCGSCHNNQSVLYVDYRDYGEIVRHPQREMLAGNAGAEVPGENYTNSIHTNLTGDCTACHYREDTVKFHTFEPTIEACQECHPGLQSFFRPARADYDGDGEVEVIQSELVGCILLLREAILTTPTSTGATITYSAPYFLIDGSNSNTGALDATDDAPLLRGMFNTNYVEFDASLAIHNTAYALQLVQYSWEEITGQPLPGVRR